MSEPNTENERRRRRKAAPVFLQMSFRPFFLFAGIWASIAVPLWLVVFANLVPFSMGMDPFLWHQHEMLFGFAAAAVTGFILTAIPNWTGRLPVRGGGLLVLVLAWVLGRMAMLASDLVGPIMTAVLDGSLLTLLTFTIGRELVSGKNWRNLPVLALISLFAIANWLVHLELLGVAPTAAMGMRLGLFVLVMLVTLIGGRIVPSFTTNWLNARGATSFPAPMGGFDRLALGATVLVLVSQTLFPDTTASAGLALLAGLLHAVRLARWRTWSILSEPILWIMHIGYAWIAVGLLLLGLSGLSSGIPGSTAVHALATGGFATMIVAVMARASLGHTGRELRASPATVLVFALVTVSALTRTAAPMIDFAYEPTLWISGIAWSVAYALFTIVFWPVLTKPRVGS